MFKPGLLIKNDLARFRFPRFVVSRLAEPAPPVPEHVDRRAEMLPSNTQGSTAQCAAYAMAGIVEWWNWKQDGIRAQVDPEPIYRYAKSIDGFPDEEGTTLEAVAQAAVALKLLPIKPNTFQTVLSPSDVRRALHKYGLLLAGFSITAGWSKAKPNGWIEEGGALLGGHAVVLIGYSDVETPNWIGAQNSWGESGYGWRGFVRMSPQQFQNEFQYGLVWDCE